TEITDVVSRQVPGKPFQSSLMVEGERVNFPNDGLGNGSGVVGFWPGGWGWPGWVGVVVGGAPGLVVVVVVSSSGSVVSVVVTTTSPPSGSVSANSASPHGSTGKPLTSASGVTWSARI